MHERDILNAVAEQYRKDGYQVQFRPEATELPDGLKHQRIDLIAHRGNEHVAIEVKGREELYDLQPDLKDPTLPEGWRFDLVVYPRNGSDELPRNGKTPEPGYTMLLIQEVEQLVAIGALRAAILIAWSAAESAMRAAAQRTKIETDNAAPRFLLKSLYSNGLMSREDFEKVGEYLNLRNEVVHGFPPEHLSPEDPKFLTDFARRLLSEEMTEASS
jgi:hypothetical protein